MVASGYKCYFSFNDLGNPKTTPGNVLEYKFITCRSILAESRYRNKNFPSSNKFSDQLVLSFKFQLIIFGGK